MSPPVISPVAHTLFALCPALQAQALWATVTTGLSPVSTQPSSSARGMAH